jgi:hypothetical protein
MALRWNDGAARLHRWRIRPGSLRGFTALLRGEPVAALPPYELADGSMALGAVMVTLDNDGTTRTIERIE